MSLGEEGFLFEWTIRADLQIGEQYFVQGSNDLDFAQLNLGNNLTVDSVTPVANGSGPALSLVTVKVATTSDRYFLRLSNAGQ